MLGLQPKPPSPNGASSASGGHEPSHSHQGSSTSDREASSEDIHQAQPTRQQHARRAPFRPPMMERGYSVADCDMRDLILVHINLHPPSPPGTLDTSVRERSLTPISEVDSDVDSLYIPRSASPDPYGNANVDGFVTSPSDASDVLFDTPQAEERVDYDPLPNPEGRLSASAPSFIFTHSPPQEPNALPDMPQIPQGSQAGQRTSFIHPTTSGSARDPATSYYGGHARSSYLPLHQSPSRQSSSSSSIYITHTVVSDGLQPARTFTYPLVTVGRSEAIAESPQYVKTSAAANRAVRGPQGQLMGHPNYSHHMIYQDITTAVGLTVGTPFQTPRQQVFSLPYHPSDHVQPSSAYPSGAESMLLNIPQTAVHASPGVPEQGHPRTSSNCSSVTPVDEHDAPPWCPKWDTFSLAVWRARNYETIDVKPEWDDEELLRELKKTYDNLRSWRKLLSLKGPRYLTRVKGNESLVYPQRIGPGHITAHRALRIRFLLKHPEHVRGRRDLMHALTGHADEGVEFVEQWQVWRAASLVLLLAFLSMVIAIATSIKLNDWSTGFSIGSFFAQMFAVVIVAIGFLHYEEL